MNNQTAKVQVSFPSVLLGGCASGSCEQSSLPAVPPSVHNLLLAPHTLPYVLHTVLAAAARLPLLLLAVAPALPRLASPFLTAPSGSESFLTPGRGGPFLVLLRCVGW